MLGRPLDVRRHALERHLQLLERTGGQVCGQRVPQRLIGVQGGPGLGQRAQPAEDRAGEQVGGVQVEPELGQLPDRDRRRVLGDHDPVDRAGRRADDEVRHHTRLEQGAQHPDLVRAEQSPAAQHERDRTGHAANLRHDRSRPGSSAERRARTLLGRLAGALDRPARRRCAGTRRPRAAPTPAARRPPPGAARRRSSEPRTAGSTKPGGAGRSGPPVPWVSGTVTSRACSASSSGLFRLLMGSAYPRTGRREHVARSGASGGGDHDD